MEKGICFISPDQPSERVVWLRCINSSWNVVFTCRLVFFALCRHIVRIRINHILVSASSYILFDPLKAERKLLLACEIWFFTCIGVIFWQVSKTQSNLTSSLALPLFSTPSMNHHFIWAKKRSSLHFNVWSSLPAREACGIARVQPFMSTKTSGMPQWSTIFAFGVDFDLFVGLKIQWYQSLKFYLLFHSQELTCFEVNQLIVLHSQTNYQIYFSSTSIHISWKISWW